MSEKQNMNQDIEVSEAEKAEAQTTVEPEKMTARHILMLFVS